MLEDPTLLSPWERDRIRQSFDVWLARRARRFHCEAAQIVAVIESIAPASASTKPTTAPAKHVAEEPLSNGSGGVQDRSESTPPPNSPEPVPEVAADRARKPSIELDAEPVRQADGDGEDRLGPQVLPAESTPRRPRGSLQDQVGHLHATHPDWPPSRIAAELGSSRAYVRASAQRLGLSLPFEATARAEPAVATLKDRILALRKEHPTWTAAMAAEHLDAKLGSVTAYGSLLGFRWPTRAEYELSQTEQPAFIGEAALRQHYAEGRKRMGVPS